MVWLIRGHSSGKYIPKESRNTLIDGEFVTFFMRSRQRWRLMSLRSPWGRSLIISISSSPPMVAHLWRSKWRTLCLNRDGSCLRRIHHSISRHLSCIFLFFAMTECRKTFYSSKRSPSIYVLSLQVCMFKKWYYLFLTLTISTMYTPGCSLSTEWRASVH